MRPDAVQAGLVRKVSSPRGCVLETVRLKAAELIPGLSVLRYGPTSLAANQRQGGGFVMINRCKWAVLVATAISTTAIFSIATHATLHATALAASQATSHAIASSGGRAAGASGYHVSKTIPVGGEGFWDYITVDADARRVYVSHGTHVVVLDADTQAVVGDIPDTQGVHGIAIASDAGRGFVSNGRANNVTMFDLKTLKTLGTIPAGTNPDAIIFDAATKRVFAMNGRSGDITAINAADGKVAGTIPVGGKLEFAAADGKGTVYVNVEDKSELVHIDAAKLTVLHRWPLAPCTEPSGLAMDTKTRRLFVGCDNKMMAIVNADTGKIVTTVPTGEGTDANGFDPATSFAFSSNGEGTLTVVHEDSADKFTVVENVPTKKSARTMALDLKTHNIFLPAADFDPPPAGEKRPKMKADSFVVLMLTR
jgi:DNA-binding beta-propeller fold protein YncE